MKDELDLDLNRLMSREEEEEKKEGPRKRKLDIENLKGTHRLLRKRGILPEHSLSFEKAKDKAAEGDRRMRVNCLKSD